MSATYTTPTEKSFAIEERKTVRFVSEAEYPLSTLRV